MNTARKMVLPITASVTLALALGLAACGGSATTPSSSANAGSGAAVEDTPTQQSSVENYNIASAWVGMDDNDDMAYYFEGAEKNTGAVLIYHTADNTYERWLGVMGVPSDSQRVITDDESGDTFEFAITDEDTDGTITIEASNGLALSMSPSPLEEVGGVLDEVSSYATQVEGSN